jgi:two-component system, sensor histidine kinase PdtaS
MAGENDGDGQTSRLRSRAEEVLGDRTSSGADSVALSAPEAQHLIHELRVHQIELTMQNEELRAAQVNLEKLKDRYQDLYEFAPVGYVTVNAKSRILEANGTALRLLGVQRRAVQRMFFSQFVRREFGDAYYLYLQRVLKTQSKQTCEIELMREDGTCFHAQLESVAVEGEEGEGLRCRTVVWDITERKKAEDQIRASLKEKKALLREIHHRVKNNLAVINSLLNLQAAYLSGKSPREVFEQIQARIRSMSAAHELLYEAESLACLKMNEYIGKLVDHLVVSWGSGGDRIRVRKEIEEISIGLQTAIPVGFLLTELVSNSLKHAFRDGRQGEVRIVFRRVAGERFELVVSDNGVGVPADIDFKNQQSMGLELIDTFVEQLEGDMSVSRHEGTEVRIAFKGDNC